VDDRRLLASLDVDDLPGEVGGYEHVAAARAGVVETRVRTMCMP